jgi:exodeoxyribonuclease VII large subunit
MMFDLPADLLTVSDLTYRIKEILEYDEGLQDIYVQGEVSNCTIHSSGHAYFTLKDEDAQLSCVMFKKYLTSKGKEILKQGARLMVRGCVTVYPQRGNYQLMVEEIKSAGVGNLYLEFLRLKEKLSQEGLFDVNHKKALPAFPKTIGIVTSPTGAVIQDILQTLERRFPCVEVMLAPALVQGDGGAVSVMIALKRLMYTPGIDVIIIARGGGSIEDLWCFNDELLARDVFACPIPVISAIGHETDFTILDFVADMRASTPTAAAEMVAPDRFELLSLLNGVHSQLRTFVQYQLNNKAQVLDDLEGRLEMQKNYLFESKKSEISLLQANLQQFNPQAFLERGFTLTLKDGKVIKSAKQVSSGDVIETVLKDTRIQSIVI